MKKTCEVCKKKTFQYVCPSCEIVYCSLECYKGHNNKCVTNFLENQVNEKIKNNIVKEHDIKEFKFKLKKFYDENIEENYPCDKNNDNEHIDGENDMNTIEEAILGNESSPIKSEKIKNDKDKSERDSSENENEDMEHSESDNSETEKISGYSKKWCISNKRYKVLTDLALKDKLTLDDLNQTEKKQFLSFLKNNDMNLYLGTFDPWWLNCVIKKMEIPEHICCTKNVNKNVIFIIVEIIYSYCYLLRIYNKSIYNKEFCYLLLEIASSLNRSIMPESNVLNTINNLFQRILENNEIAREKNILYNVITDVTKILDLKDLVLRCLYKTKKIFKKEIGKINKKKDQLYNKGNNASEVIMIFQDQKLFKYVNKKIKFLYSYANYHFDDFTKPKEQLSMFYKQQASFIQANEKREVVLSAKN
ncbi:zinc finger protein, putative [Plasmodium vinckei lentum]|uniref:Zinc finger protein, putative n=1 Tax=Plasmodium vinckei lentum TaxID=138297 RepID=A0A6V7S7Q7_PLAVN|nr:zinc finger protein, putative [Plasmodium vinckei lentum]